MKIIGGGWCVALAGLVGAVVGGCASDRPAPSEPDRLAVAAPAQPKVLSADPLPAPPVAAPAVAAAPSVGGVIARVGDRAVSTEQLIRPLIEAHGLNMLLAVMQLEIVKEQAERARVTITPADVAAEKEMTLSGMFVEYVEKMDDRIADAERAGKADEVSRLRQVKSQELDGLLEQYYNQRRVTPTEFGLVLQMNAYLRKWVAPQIEGKITDAILEQQFRAKYGETIRVRHIQVNRPQDIWEVQRRLKAGEAFEKVAMEMSKNQQTRPLGGELPPFSRASNFPQNFKDAAFALKEGEVSPDMIEAGDTYHLIKLEQRIMPKAVKFEDVKEGLRRDLYQAYVFELMTGVRRKIQDEIRTNMKVEDPGLAKQFAQRLAEGEAQTKGQRAGEQLQQDWQRERDRREAQPAGPETQPSPVGPAATQRSVTQPGDDLRARIEAVRAARREAESGVTPGTTQPAAPAAAPR